MQRHHPVLMSEVVIRQPSQFFAVVSITITATGCQTQRWQTQPYFHYKAVAPGGNVVFVWII